MTHHTHHYHIIESSSFDKLQCNVNYYFRRGGQLIGSPFVFNNKICQAMLLPHEHEY